MAGGVLFSQMNPPAGAEAEFYDWYDAEHIPARLALPGFRTAARYRTRDGEPEHLAVYELDDLNVLDTPAYRELKTRPSERTTRMLGGVTGFTRFVCELVSERGAAREPTHLWVVAFTVPPEDVAAFDDWYESEHVPLLLEARGWLRVRRLRVVAGEGRPWTHLALHDLATPAALESPQRAAAQRGAKRAALAQRAWFGRAGRRLYEAVAHHA